MSVLQKGKGDHEVERRVFDPSAFERLCREDIAAALRTLADHVEGKEISATLWNFEGNGMVQDWRREHFLLTINLAVAPLKGEGSTGEV